MILKKLFLIIIVLSISFSAMGNKIVNDNRIVNGVVLNVNYKHNLIIINLGKEDGVEKNMEFFIYREKKLLGKVAVEEVFEDMSSCAILPWYKNEEMKINDGVMKP